MVLPNFKMSVDVVINRTDFALIECTGPSSAWLKLDELHVIAGNLFTGKRIRLISDNRSANRPRPTH